MGSSFPYYIIVLHVGEPWRLLGNKCTIVEMPCIMICSYPMDMVSLRFALTFADVIVCITVFLCVCILVCVSLCVCVCVCVQRTKDYTSGSDPLHPQAHWSYNLARSQVQVSCSLSWVQLRHIKWSVVWELVENPVRVGSTEGKLYSLCW